MRFSSCLPRHLQLIREHVGVGDSVEGNQMGRFTTITGDDTERRYILRRRRRTTYLPVFLYSFLLLAKM